jgi:hypothetical protein
LEVGENKITVLNKTKGIKARMELKH